MGWRSFGDQSVFNIKRTGTTQSASVPLKLSAQAPRCVNGLSPGKLPYNGMSYRGTVCDSAKNKEKFLTLEKHHKIKPIECCTGWSYLLLLDKVNILHSIFFIYMKQSSWCLLDYINM